MKQTIKTRKKKTRKYPPDQAYEKVNGKYIPIPHFPTNPEEGVWLIQKHKGSTSYKQMVSKLSDLPDNLTDLTKLEVRRDELSGLLLAILDGYRVMSVNDLVTRIFEVLTDDNKIDLDKPANKKFNGDRVPLELVWRLIGKVVEFEYCIPVAKIPSRTGKLNREKFREKKIGIIKNHDGILRHIIINDGLDDYREEEIDLKTIRVIPPEEEIIWKLEHENKSKEL
jgi:hypothetical protein